MKKLMIIAVTLMSIVSSASLVKAADVQAGKTLHDQHCIACHTSLMKGKPGSIYTREDRRIKSFGQLSQQVRRCVASLGAQWSDRDIHGVAVYLNQTYYKF